MTIARTRPSDLNRTQAPAAPTASPATAASQPAGVRPSEVAFERVNGAPALPAQGTAAAGAGPRLLQARNLMGWTRDGDGLPNVDSKLATLKQLMSGGTDRTEEKAVLNLFRGASKGELNALVQQCNLHELVEDMDDRWIGPDNRTAFLQLLTADRLGDLSVKSRAVLITAIQRGDTDSVREGAIRNVLLGTTGAELTALKNAVDAGGDHHDLANLVHHDLDDAGIRGQVIRHIQAQAAGTTTGQNKILSDIDDTFYANWVDKSFPGKVPYPGVVQFYRELDLGGGNAPDRVGDLGFLTARPGDRPGANEALIQKMLRGHGVQEATIHTGDLAHFVGNERIAEKKFENFQKAQQLYPEYGFVLVGDSGQGDVMVGEKMLAHNASAVNGVFIHDVKNTPEAERAQYRARGIFFFDTYVGAATEAFRKKLITADGLQRIMDSAQADLGRMPFENAAQKTARTAELERDLGAARAALGL